MEEHKELYFSQNMEQHGARIRPVDGTVTDIASENFVNLQDDRPTTLSPNSDPNDQVHMAEFQKAIECLRLRRPSSRSSQGIQGHDGSRKSSIGRDLLQGQKAGASTSVSPTCVSPMSSNGAYSN